MNCKWFLDEKKLSIFNNNINKDSIKKGIYVTAIGRVEYDQYEMCIRDSSNLFLSCLKS